MKGDEFEAGRAPAELSEHLGLRAAARRRAEEGTVVSVHGEMAKVLVRRGRACEGCGSCCVKLDQETMLADAFNREGAEPGDRVLVDLPENLSIRAAYILYGVPLMFFLAGLGLGALISSAALGGGFSAPLSLACAFGLLAASFLLISRVYRPGSRAAARYRPVITKVLGPRGEAGD